MKKILIAIIVLLMNCVKGEASDSWFKQNIDPNQLIDQIKVYYDEKIDYHNHMARTCLEFHKKSVADQLETLEEMYGVEGEYYTRELELFKQAYDDHTKWMLQFIKIRNAIKDRSDNILNLLYFFKKNFDDGVDFYKNSSAVMTDFFMKEAKFAQGKSQGNIFLKNHTIKENNDGS